jgi:hypothetical protein
MTIARIVSIGAVVMFALIATFDAVYGLVPCCTVKNGVWIVTKTGKPASPAQIRTMEKFQTRGTTGSSTGGTTGSSNPPLPVGGW